MRGDFVGRSSPLKGRKSWGFERESVRVECGEKLQKSDFLRFEKLSSLDRQWTKIADKVFILKKTFT
jgi:hypothetical protein